MDTKLICPRAHPEADDIALELGEIYRAEARIMEIQGITKAKAPELLSVFNRAYLQLSGMIRELELEHLRATRIAKKRRSVILLDEAKDLLISKGLATNRSPAGSADQREALLDGDDEYQAALERAETIKVYQELLQDKRKGIEMGYHSVKRLISEEAYARNVNLNGTMPDNSEPGYTIVDMAPTIEPVKQSTTGHNPWGTPTY